MATRGQAISERYRKLVTEVYPAIGPSQATTTFTVYRRALQGTGQRNSLGIRVRPTAQDFDPIITGVPGTFYGVKRTGERWEVVPEGQVQTDYVMLFTDFHVQEGDNILLDYDGKVYLVEASSYVDSLRQCLLNSTKAQVTVDG